MTVSRALNNREKVRETTRRKVLEKVREMGYTPNLVAKSLVSKKTNTIGVIIPQITHSFFPEVVRGIEEVTNQLNYQLLLANANEQFETEKEAIVTFCSKRVDGLLISSSIRETDYSFYKDLKKRVSAIVFFDRCIENIGISSVSINDFGSSKAITNHLIEVHDYKRIGHLSGPFDVSIGQKRYAGYRNALQEHGIRIENDWIVECGFSEGSGYEGMRRLLRLPFHRLPSAIVAVNDPVAIGAMEAIKEAKLSIPGDLAIVGFTDDVRASLLEVPLTTVHQPAYRVGKRAAQKLIAAIEDEDEPAENIELLASIKFRHSCGC